MQREKRMTKKHIEFEYNQITPHIIIGTNACCIVDFRRELLMKGVRADISLEEKRVDSPKGVTHFLWLPVKDHHAPKPSQFQMGVACLHCCVANKINVYVHCEHGHGRAPTLVAAYLIFTGMKVDEAIAYIKKRRPTMHVTKRQLAALRRYARRER